MANVSKVRVTAATTAVPFSAAPAVAPATATQIAIIYAVLAIIATGANLIAQDIFIRTYSGPFGVVSSLAAGTLVGLVVKYELDKRYIFQFRAKDLQHDGRTFALYAFMGVFTTLIFWGSELAFHYAFDDKTMRYIGGLIGLAIGYVTKYQLDRRFVFRATR